MQGDDHTDVVTEVKRQLVLRGVPLTGPCGAFEITKRVAWALREEGAGLLSKPDGNNCNGFAVDIVAYRDGTIVDMLANAENENRPAWQLGPANGSLVYRWRLPIDPGDVPVPIPTPPPVPVPVPPAFDFEAALDALFDDVDRIVAGLSSTTTAIAALNTRLDELQQRGVRVHL